MAKPLYGIATWDVDAQSYTPQEGVPAFNLTRRELVASIRTLQAMGYSCHRYGNLTSEWRDNDTHVLIERTDGMRTNLILQRWER